MPPHVSSTVVPIKRTSNRIIQHMVSSHSVGGCPVRRLLILFFVYVKHKDITYKYTLLI